MPKSRRWFFNSLLVALARMPFCAFLLETGNGPNETPIPNHHSADSPVVRRGCRLPRIKSGHQRGRDA